MRVVAGRARWMTVALVAGVTAVALSARKRGLVALVTVGALCVLVALPRSQRRDLNLVAFAARRPIGGERVVRWQLVQRSCRDARAVASTADLAVRAALSAGMTVW
jgi:hypothetical protein